MTVKTIFTLDARDNIFLDVIKNRYNLDHSIIYSVINDSFKKCISILEQKNINYQDLKNSLVPRSDRNEIAFVFDRNRIDSSSYGFNVFSKLIPLFSKESCNSVLCGDYIGDNKRKDKLKFSFYEHIKSDKQINYINHNQFYIVYINNLSDKMVATFNDGLKQFNPYVGYFDLTYSSFLKTYLSTILVRLFIKSKTIIIAGHEDDRNNEEDVNVSKYPFEKNGFKCKSIQSMYYSLFLSYKIERKVYEGFESDTNFAINAISENVLDISDFTILVKEDKLRYILNEKADNLERAGITNLTLDELEIIIKAKIRSNYIYNLSFLKQSGTLKFNILIETKRTDTNKLMKLVVALEYMPMDKILRLITMF
jgi:hypothetical protein